MVRRINHSISYAKSTTGTDKLTNQGAATIFFQTHAPLDMPRASDVADRRRTLYFSFISPNDKDFDAFPYKLHHISGTQGTGVCKARLPRLLVILTMIYEG